jgi:hypothetical protein
VVAVSKIKQSHITPLRVSIEIDIDSRENYKAYFILAHRAFEWVKCGFPDVHVHVNVNVSGQPEATLDQNIAHSTLVKEDENGADTLKIGVW